MELKQHLELMANLYRNNTRPDAFKYFSMEEFILKNGTPYTTHAPNPRQQGRMGECFKNAAQLALDDPSLTYVEGYALNMIPMMHAWCINKSGQIVDPTWAKEKDLSNIQYFGVPISKTYLRNTMLSRKKYGVIDNPEEGFPLLKGKGNFKIVPEVDLDR